MSSEYTTHQNTYTARECSCGFEYPDQTGAPQGFVCFTIGRPSHCSIWAGRDNGNIIKKKTFPAPHRLSMLSEDKLLDRALKLLKKAVSEKQTRQQEQDVLCRFHLLVCVVF